MLNKIRLLLLTLLLVAANWPAAAQDSLATQVQAATAPQVLPDTAAALHRFYHAKRQLRTAVLLGTVAIYGVSVVAGPDKYGSYDGTAIRVISYTPIWLIAEITELIYFGQYSRRRERRAIANWQAHRLSPDIAHRLAPKYFTD